MFIFITSLIATIAFALTGSLTFWKVSEPYHFYIPLVLLLTGYIACIAIWWILLWLFGRGYFPSKEYTKPSSWAKFWHDDGHQWLMLHARIKIKVMGKEKLPTSHRFLLVSNHRSNFDSMTLTPVLRKHKLSFITKRSNLKIPLFNRFMRGLCYLPIDRDDPLQSLEVMKKASALISEDKTNVVVYPEGTRQTENIIGPFHEGVFNIALRAKCPIVIVTTSGTDQVHKRAPFKRTKVRIDILGVLDYDYLEGKTAKFISDKIHTIMEEHLERVGV